MANRRAVRWRQREATRGVRAVQAAGLEVERVEMSPDGKITIYPARSPRSLVEEKPKAVAVVPGLREWNE